MHHLIRIALLITFCWSLTGCIQGVLYSDVTLPESLDMRSTPVGEEEGRSALNQISEPITAARIAAQWNSKGIGDAYKRGELERGYYADMRTQSAFFGTWKKERVIVWGKKRGEAQEQGRE